MKYQLRNRLEKLASEYVYSTPHRLSTAVFLAVHGGLASSQTLIGNDYFQSKANQFVEHPVATLFEISVPYLITYASSSIGRKIRK
jgi:hypothetical protein